jgi:peptidoglycan hydrolase-like protein with peptidoglycan-binding domain
MSDPMVLKAQKWLNTKFASVAGYTPCTEDGITGQKTIDRIIMGLQSKLGISPVVPTVGPTTWSLMQQYGTINGSGDSVDMIKLLECGLYCKGYDGDSIDGLWTTRLSDGIKDLQQDMGHTGTGLTGTASPKFFRALLNTDAFILVPEGDAAIRQAQQWLNVTYIAKTNYLYCPTDGLFNRNTQTALVYGLQYDLGQTDAQADGQYGTGTAAQLQASAAVNIQIGTTDSTKRWVRLFKCLMLFNKTATTLNGSFVTADSNSVKRFQSFSGFSTAEQTGKGDFRTWSELLVSTGDPNRSGTAADMASTITAARATALVNAGYKTVGRYLTNFQLPGALDKNIKPGELTTIFNAGLTLFPIFEEGGDEAIWFTYNQGQLDAVRAYQAATAYGLPAGTIIYFAVDFDAVDADIDEKTGPGANTAISIINYFKGVRNKLTNLLSPYTIGIYGTRNVCSRLSSGQFPIAVSSYIAGMSTGWSGNLGFQLPANWAFNQIQNLTIGTGTGAIEIDKNVKSGRDNGVTGLTTPVDPNHAAIEYVNWVQAKAVEYKASHSAVETASGLVVQYLRYPEFTGLHWDVLAGPLNGAWLDWMNAQAVPKLGAYVENGFHIVADIAHLAGTTNGVMFLGNGSGSQASVSDFGGWAGDIISMFRVWNETRNDYTSTYNWAKAMINANEATRPESLFSRTDFSQDAVGYNFGRTIYQTPTTSFAALFNATYKRTGNWANRYTTFYANRFGSSPATALAAAKDVFFDTGPVISTVRNDLFANDFDPSVLTTSDKNAVAQAYADAIVTAAS